MRPLTPAFQASGVYGSAVTLNGAAASRVLVLRLPANGAYAHLSNRAAFVVSSPDTPEKQQKFAESRHWTFPMVSHEGTTFAEDMGYRRDGGWMPGVSVFRRQNGRIVRVSDAPFSPGDDFCSVWHFFDLIPEGAAGWEPKYKYP